MAILKLKRHAHKRKKPPTPKKTNGPSVVYNITNYNAPPPAPAFPPAFPALTPAAPSLAPTTASPGSVPPTSPAPPSSAPASPSPPQSTMPAPRGFQVPSTSTSAPFRPPPQPSAPPAPAPAGAALVSNTSGRPDFSGYDTAHIGQNLLHYGGAALETLRAGLNAPVYGPITAGDVGAVGLGFAAGGPAGALTAFNAEQRLKMGLGAAHATKAALEGNASEAGKTAAEEVALPYLGGRLVGGLASRLGGLASQAANFVRRYPGAALGLGGLVSSGAGVASRLGLLGLGGLATAARTEGQAISRAAGRDVGQNATRAAGRAPPVNASSQLTLEDAPRAPTNTTGANETIPVDNQSFWNTGASSAQPGTYATGHTIGTLPTMEEFYRAYPHLAGMEEYRPVAGFWSENPATLASSPMRPGLSNYSDLYGLPGAGAGAGTNFSAPQIAPGRHLTVDERQRKRRF